jgi:hypothetical protein
MPFARRLRSTRSSIWTARTAAPHMRVPSSRLITPEIDLSVDMLTEVRHQDIFRARSDTLP